MYVNCSFQKDLLMKNSSEENYMRNEMLKYEQKLNRERLRCQALEEMLLKPTNIHRWRLLKVICVTIYFLSSEIMTSFNLSFFA